MAPRFLLHSHADKGPRDFSIFCVLGAPFRHIEDHQKPGGLEPGALAFLQCYDTRRPGFSMEPSIHRIGSCP